jgi:hypothetical protein
MTHCPTPSRYDLAHPFTGRLIKGLESTCTLLAICTALFGCLALYLIMTGQAMGYLELSSNASALSPENASAASEGLSIQVDTSKGAVSAMIDILIEASFSIALFLSLRTLLSSLRQEPGAAQLIPGLRRIAIVTLIWPFAALFGQLSGSFVSGSGNPHVQLDLSLNLPMLVTGIATWIGCMATQGLAQAEQELESVI